MSKYYDNYGHKDKQQLKKGYSYHNADGGEEVYHRKATKGKYGRWGGGKDSYKHTAGKSELKIYKIPEKKAPANQQTPAPAKPAVPKEQSQKIEPVTASPEMAQAKSRVQAYEKKDYSSIFNQNETDFTSKFQPSSSQNTPDGAPQKDPQEFADKYKLNLSNAGGSQLTDTTSDNPMTADDILKKDKQQFGSYM